MLTEVAHQVLHHAHPDVHFDRVLEEGEHPVEGVPVVGVRDLDPGVAETLREQEAVVAQRVVLRRRDVGARQTCNAKATVQRHRVHPCVSHTAEDDPTTLAPFSGCKSRLETIGEVISKESHAPPQGFSASGQEARQIHG